MTATESKTAGRAASGLHTALGSSGGSTTRHADDQQNAHEAISRGRELMVLAMDSLRRGDAKEAGRLAGLGSNAVGSAIFFLRHLVERARGAESMDDLAR